MMKKFLLLTLLAMLLIPSALGLAEDTEGGEARHITPGGAGFICDRAHVGGWTVFMGYGFDREGAFGWGILGTPEGGGETAMLVSGEPVGIVPSGVSFVYYGLGGDGFYHWLAQNPGEEPRRLPLSWKDSVFYGDEDGVWFSRAMDTSWQALYRIGLDGQGKRYMGLVRGSINGVLEDGSILLADHRKNTVSAWKDRKTLTLYSTPSEQLYDVAIAGHSLWAVHFGHFGRIADGELRDIQQGYATVRARSGSQLVLLVLDESSAGEARVILIDDAMNAWTELGRVPYDPYARAELSVASVIIWGQEPRLLAIPESADVDAWIPYEE